MNERRTGTGRSHRGSNPKERAVGKKGPRPGASGARPQVTDASAEQVKIGDRIVVTIKRIGINGEGVGYYRKKAVFLDGALPGEVVRAKVSAVHDKHIVAAVTAYEKESPDRRQPPCPVYERCGGCQLQHLAYEGQLRAKEELVREAFRRYAGIEGPALPLKPMLGMDDPWHYRNKAQLQLGAGRDGRIVAGLYEAQSHQLVDITGCTIQHDRINQTVEEVKAILERLHIAPYDAKRRSGVVRTIIVRTGFQSDDLQLTLVTGTETLPKSDQLVSELLRKVPDLTTIAHNINTRKTSLVFGDKTRILWGKPTMEDSLGDVKFSLSPRAFFQLNPQQTLKLYEAVRVAAALSGRERVVDAYCGTGTIALWLAPYAAEVRGIEIIPEAVDNARQNAERSGRANAAFYAGEAETLLPRWVKDGYRPDVIVVDPPRTGCDERLRRAILAAKPKRLVYVSCNPSTLAKDCKALLAGGYELASVQPVDMFPQTAHVECCVLLTKCNDAL